MILLVHGDIIKSPLLKCCLEFWEKKEVTVLNVVSGEGMK
jgi:hypothetical protein